MDIGLFRQSNYAWANATTLVFGATFSTMFLGLFLFLTGPWDMSSGMAGMWIAPGPLVVVPVAVLAGRLAGRIGHRPLMASGGLLFAASQWWFRLQLADEPQLWVWAVGLVLSGVGVGLVLPALSGAAVARLEPQHFGVGNAANAAIRQIGAALGAAVAVSLVGEAGATLAQFKTLYAVMIFGGLATALLSLPIETRPRTETSEAGTKAAASKA
ncbi:MAG: MFS transporter [Betaproteobacteria bacterium]|nr:MFS transporter [Betaproteobacteria bacterium]